MSDIRLDLAVHDLACPHCEKLTQHSWPGSKILFSSAKCQHCGMDFLIVQNKPWLGDREANAAPS
jgi:hypothetical protein